MGSSGGTSLGLLVWEAARPATALSLCRPTHFRQRSVILKTVEVMSAATPLVLSSVAVIYTKWCLPQLDAMQTAHLQCRTWNWKLRHKSSLCLNNISDIVCLKCCFFLSPLLYSKLLWTTANSCLEVVTLWDSLIVIAVIVRVQRLFIVSSQRVII